MSISFGEDLKLPSVRTVVRSADDLKYVEVSDQLVETCVPATMSKLRGGPHVTTMSKLLAICATPTALSLKTSDRFDGTRLERWAPSALARHAASICGCHEGDYLVMPGTVGVATRSKHSPNRWYGQPARTYDPGMVLSNRSRYSPKQTALNCVALRMTCPVERRITVLAWPVGRTDGSASPASAECRRSNDQ